MTSRLLEKHFVILAEVKTPDPVGFKPPNIINFETKILVNASQTRRLICEAEAQPLFPDMEWFKNGVRLGSCKGELRQNKTCRLHSDQSKYKITWTGSGAELTIRNALHPFDDGDFTCVASNTAGVDNRTVTLDVHGKLNIPSMGVPPWNSKIKIYCQNNVNFMLSKYFQAFQSVSVMLSASFNILHQAHQQCSLGKSDSASLNIVEDDFLIRMLDCRQSNIAQHHTTIFTPPPPQE